MTRLNEEFHYILPISDILIELAYIDFTCVFQAV